MRENKALGIILPGGDNEQMGVLIEKRTVGSIPFGGRYRMIDFILSGMVHAGIWDVGVITRNKYESLMDHLGNGSDWDLARKNGGLTLLPPFLHQSGSGAFRGEIESLATYQGYIRKCEAAYVVLANADIVTSFDLDAVIERHAQSGADLTIVANTVRSREDLGERALVLTADGDDHITDIAISPKWQGPCLRSLGVVVIEKNLLLRQIEDLYSHSRFSLIQDLIQGRCGDLDMRVYRLDGYCARVQNIVSYYKANMDLLNREVREELFRQYGPVLTRVRDEPPVKYGLEANISNSLVADGCIIEGTVEHSVIFRGVKIAKGAVVRNSIVMRGTEIGPNASLSYGIVDRNCLIQECRTLAGFETYPVVIGKNSVV